MSQTTAVRPFPLVYISHASTDIAYARSLKMHLAPHVRRRSLALWHRGDVAPGDSTEPVARQHLAGARVIVLLLSAELLDERADEVDAALQRGQQGVCVLPVRLRAAVEIGDSFRGLQTIPDAPIAPCADKDAAWTEVATRVLEAAGVPPLAAITPDHSELLRAFAARDDLDSALTNLLLTGGYLQDRTLRDDASDRRRQLDRLAERDPEARARVTEELRTWLTEEVVARPAEVKSAGPPVLKCAGLTKRFGRDVALPAVDLELRHGQIAAVVGPNGSGKTTLLRMIAGELRPSAGTVQVRPMDDRGRKLENPITFVPQDLQEWKDALHAYLRRQAAFFGRDTPRWNADVVEEAVRLLGLERELDKTYSEMSGGYRMRAAIAGALVADPGVLVLDEPLAPLDPPSQQRLLQELVSRAKAKRTAIVVTSQHVREIESVADTMVMLFRHGATVVPRVRVDRAGGRVFEIQTEGTAGSTLQQIQALKGQGGSVERFTPGTCSVVVWFCAAQTLEEVARALGRSDVIGIQDITDSALALHYSEVSAVKEGSQHG